MSGFFLKQSVLAIIFNRRAPASRESGTWQTAVEAKVKISRDGGTSSPSISFTCNSSLFFLMLSLFHTWLDGLRYIVSSKNSYLSKSTHSRQPIINVVGNFRDGKRVDHTTPLSRLVDERFAQSSPPSLILFYFKYIWRWGCVANLCVYFFFLF